MGGKKFSLGRIRKHPLSGKCRKAPGRPSKISKQAGSISSNSPPAADQLSTAQTTEQLPSDIATLHSSLANLKAPWIDQTSLPLTQIHLCILSNQSGTSKQPIKITHSLTIHEDLTWEVFVVGQRVCATNSPLSSIPVHLCSDSLSSLLVLIEESTICPGNPDERFVQLVSSRKGRRIASDDGSTSAYLDDGFDVKSKGETYSSTVRTASCTILTQGNKCHACSQYRSHLRSLHSRASRKMKSPSKYQNNRYLSTPDKEKKLKVLQERALAAESEVRRLKLKIEESMLRHGVEVDEGLHRDLSNIMEASKDTVSKEFPQGSFRRLFWDEQLKIARLKDSRQMRWHPMMIRWCLNLKLLSSSAYHALRTSGFVKLPSERTLRDYTHFFKVRSGFQVEVDKMLVRDMKLEELPEWKKHVVLLLDEVKIKESLVYDKDEAQIIGYVDLGTVNDQLDQFERESADTLKPPEVANHILAIMVRGIFIHLKFPYAHFPTKGIHSDYLFSIVWEAVERLEKLGVKVLVITADGASPNRKFFRMHRGHKEKLCYKTSNPYTDEKRAVYFVSDVPHLLKTTRNCWSHSYAHGCSRKLWVNGKNISWQHLRSLYDAKIALGEKSSGLYLLKKLSNEHIQLTSYSRMRVDLAAQVLSESVANGLKVYVSQEDTSETEKFVRIMDKFFDCLNGRNLKEHITRRKPNLRPYYSPNDGRLKWLLEEFLGYLDAWETSVSKRDVPAAERPTMMLSKETLEGLRLTVHSFVEVAKYLLSLPGVEGQYILSECFSQDPLENHFGQLRARGGRCDNPTVKSVLDSAQSLRIQRSAALQPVRGNCSRKRRLFTEEVIDDEPLQKRRAKNRSS